MTDQFLTMANQLSCPSGEAGVEIALAMQRNNAAMINDSIHALNIVDNDQFLELGHGNGSHVPYLLSQAKNLAYTGLEISELMQSEAQALNKSNGASFQLYDGEHLPFEDEVFTKVMTVNTLYFWKNVEGLLNDIYRVLIKGGTCCIAFGQRSFMEKLPFTKYVFELYDNTKFEDLVSTTPFIIKELKEVNDQLTSNAGETVDRKYTIAVLQK